MNAKNILIDDIKSILENSYKTFNFPPNNRFINTSAFLLYAKEILNNMDKHTNINFPDSYIVKKPIKISKPNYIYIYMPTYLHDKTYKYIHKLYDSILKYENNENNTIVLDFSGTKIMNYAYANLFCPFTDSALLIDLTSIRLEINNTDKLKVVYKIKNNEFKYEDNKLAYKKYIKNKELHVICDSKNIIIETLTQFKCFAYKYNNFDSKNYFYTELSIPFKNKIYNINMAASNVSKLFDHDYFCKIIEGDIPKELFPL